MDYYKLLNLDREPFSNTPDPEMFFQSGQHVGCLQKLELAIRMRRGLNIVLGEVGTGKTTVCRQLLRRLAGDERIVTHLVLDADYEDPGEFLRTVTGMLGLAVAEHASEWQLKEAVKQYLFRAGVDEGRTVVLVIDEGQKAPDFCLELLREFLNYETNDAKLLQIVIFAQREFSDRLRAMPNFADRVNQLLELKPLTLGETRDMIRYRLEVASADGRGGALFTGLALMVIHRASGGYPRKIINLCHQIILALVIQNKNRAGYRLAAACARRISGRRFAGPVAVGTAVAAAGLAMMLVYGSGQNRFAGFLPPAGGRQSNTEISRPQAAKKAPGLSPSPVQRPAPPDPATSGKRSVPQTGEKTIATGTSTRMAATVQPAVGESTETRPGYLGKIRVRSSDTLGSMIRAVYGPYTFTRKNVEALLRFNPQISDPDVIEVGEIIRFPDMQAAGTSGMPAGWGVRLAVANRLEDAYRLYRDLAGKIAEPLEIKRLSGRRQPGFQVILVKNYSGPDEARQGLLDLPPELGGRAEVVQLRPSGVPGS